MATVNVTNSSNFNGNSKNNGIGTPGYSKTLYFVEPLKNLPVDNKNLFIYANLTATRKARTILQLTDESSPQIRSSSTNESEINLIGYRQTKEGDRIMTTDWSNKYSTGKVTDFNTQGTFEGFGLESIDINITAMNPPTVNIKFIDTRGGGLFDQETFNENVAPINAFQNDNSPYNIFFEMPPPLFYLTLKGYYGSPVTFCLYLIKWDGTFNSETGNFEINANFLGYTFAFLQDIRIGHLISAGNTEKGKNKLTEVTSVPTEEGCIFPELTIDDLSVKLQRITTLREETQKNSEDFAELRVINEQIKYMKMFMTYLGYFSPETNISTVYGAYLNQGILKPNIEQMFFRDVGIISEQSKNNYDNLGKIVKNGLNQYKQFKEGNLKYFVQDADFTETDIGGFKLEFDNITETRTNIQETIDKVNVLVKENEPTANIKTITVKDFTGKTQNNWPLNSGFRILNLRSTRSNINTKIEKLQAVKATKENEIQLKFNQKVEEELGFKPNIKNIIGILCNNIEMFLSLTYDVGRDAESKKNQRYINLGNYLTDSPEIPGEEKIVYPFPKVVDRDLKEIYLGSIETLDEQLFPEIPFVDELCNALVYSIKQNQERQRALLATQKIATSDSFPINISDVGNNPYTNLSGLPMQSDGTLNPIFAEKIIERIFLFYDISNYISVQGGEVSLNKVANLEAINFYETLYSQTYKDLFNNIDATTLFNLALNNNIIKTVTGSTTTDTYVTFYKPLNKEFEIDNNGTTNSGTRLWDKVLTLKDPISKEIKDNVDLKSFESKKPSTQYVKRYFDGNTCYLNKTYLTLETFLTDTVKNSIKEGYTSLDSANLFESYTLDKLRTVNDFFTVPRTAQNTLRQPITKTTIYQNSDNFGKAYLILSSFDFKTESLLYDEIKDDYNKLIRVPWFYLLWVGANFYRTYNPTEILAFNSEFPVKPKGEYYYVSTNKTLKSSFTDNMFGFYLEDYFINWVQSQEFYTLRTTLENLYNVQNLNSNDTKKLTDTANPIIFKEYDLKVFDPKYEITPYPSKPIKTSTITQYLNTFIQKYKTIYKPNDAETKKKESVQVNDVVKDEDIKKAYYLDLKHIYDNWIAGNPSDVIYSCCKTVSTKKSGQRLKLFDLFKFVDKFRNPIAGNAITNINSFNDLISKRDLGMYSFISKVLTDSYFMHFNLPIYIEFNNSDEVQKMFEPQTNLDKLTSSPNFLCVYNGPPSSTLNSGRNFANDSFKFNGPTGAPSSVSQPTTLESTSCDKSVKQNTYLVAFNVNYGSQSQSIFKNIQVSSQESKTTGEYITLLSDYVTGTGAAKPLLKDNSIFSLQRNRSYTSTIQMMGDLMIQPQMYYQLNNIPFFGGSYMIMNVSHSVKANNMNTTFKGVRQNPSPVKLVTEVTTFLNFQFDQTATSGFSFTQGLVLTASNQTNSATPANLNRDTIANYKPSVGTTILRPFTENPNHKALDIEVTTPNTVITSVNKNGSVFYNVIGINVTDTPQQPPRYTFDVYSTGDGWQAKIYNNNSLIEVRDYIQNYQGDLSSGDPKQNILSELEFFAQQFGFVSTTGVVYPSYNKFAETGQTTYLPESDSNKILNGVLIVKHDKEDDGFTYFTGYYGLYENSFNINDTISPKKSIGKPSKYMVITPSSQPTTQTTTTDFSPYFILKDGTKLTITNVGPKRTAIATSTSGTVIRQGTPSITVDNNKLLEELALTFSDTSTLDQVAEKVLTPPVTQPVGETNKTYKYYYHFEVRRTNKPETVISYTDYLKLDLINIPNELTTKIVSSEIHDNTIYDIF